jgi:hypothetical protein
VGLRRIGKATEATCAQIVFVDDLLGNVHLAVHVFSIEEKISFCLDVRNDPVAKRGRPIVSWPRALDDLQRNVQFLRDNRTRLFRLLDHPCFGLIKHADERLDGRRILRRKRTADGHDAVNECVAFGQGPPHTGQFFLLDKGWPDSPCINLTSFEGTLGIGRSHVDNLHVIWRDARLLQKFEDTVMRTRTGQDGDLGALEISS